MEPRVLKVLLLGVRCCQRANKAFMEQTEVRGCGHDSKAMTGQGGGDLRRAQEMVIKEANAVPDPVASTLHVFNLILFLFWRSVRFTPKLSREYRKITTYPASPDTVITRSPDLTLGCPLDGIQSVGLTNV